MVCVVGRPKQGVVFAPLESQIMEVVWRAAEPVAVRRVLDELNEHRPQPLAYTTVMTVMNRLLAKGALEREGQRRRYLYRATATDAAGIAVHEVIRNHGDAAVAHFLEAARADPDVLRRLRALLAEGL